MFEREIRDAAFLDRWAIVRTLQRQSVAEHSFMVAMYVNDICQILGDRLPMGTHFCALRYALWHDVSDEIFTSDLPGPNKRALLAAPGAREHWDATLHSWSERTFKNYRERSGLNEAMRLGCYEEMKLIVKIADWLEAACRMGEETQLGNGCTGRHVVPNLNGALATANELCDKLRIPRNGDVPLPGSEENLRNKLLEALGNAVFNAQHGQSAGPWITREDDAR